MVRGGYVVIRVLLLQPWTNCKACVCGGYVGDYSKYKDDPTSAPDATNENAFCHANQNFDPSINF